MTVGDALPGMGWYMSDGEELTQPAVATATTTVPSQRRQSSLYTDGHTSLAPVCTPILDGSRPGPQQVGCIIHAFRMRLGRIGGVTTKDLDKWLAIEGWEVDVAIKICLEIIIPAARTAHESNEPGRTLIQQQKDYMLAGASYSRHGNHRRTIAVLYKMIQTKFPGDVITVLRLANLLRETFFDFEEAVMIHEERRRNAEEMAEIERAERRLCILGPGGAEPTQVHKDTRSAVFLEIVATDDWVSARDFLSSAANGWNLGLALDRWMQSGLPTTQPTPREFRRKRYQAPQLGHIEQDNLWPAPRPLFQMTTADASDIADSIEDYGNGAYTGEVSRYINLDPYRTIAGINRPDLLEQFHINRGRGTVIPILADGVLKGKGLVPMSFQNTKHIITLNKIYLQNPSRSGGISKRQPGIRYTHGECDWMYCWHENRVMKYQAKNPGFVLADDKTWADFVNFNKDSLTRDFNHEFQEMVTVGSVHHRPKREVQSVNLRRVGSRLSARILALSSARVRESRICRALVLVRIEAPETVDRNESILDGEWIEFEGRMRERVDLEQRAQARNRVHCALA